jgi:hypothetical protein
MKALTTGLCLLAVVLASCSSESRNSEQGDTTIISAPADSSIEGNSADTTVSGLQNNKDMSTGTDGVKDSMP